MVLRVGDTPTDVQLMRRTVDGIRTLADALVMIEAGASRSGLMLSQLEEELRPEKDRSMWPPVPGAFLPPAPCSGYTIEWLAHRYPLTMSTGSSPLK